MTRFRKLTRCSLRCGLVVAGWAAMAQADSPFCERAAIFPPNAKHNHASCVIQTKAGDLLAAWYSGSGAIESMRPCFRRPVEV